MINYNYYLKYVAIAMIGVMASCSVSNDVASNRGIQKRKYTKGYFFDFKQKLGGIKNADEIAINKNDEVRPITNKEKVIFENSNENLKVEKVPAKINELSANTTSPSSTNDGLSSRGDNQGNNVKNVVIDSKEVDNNTVYSSTENKNGVELGPIKDLSKKKSIKNDVKQKSEASGMSDTELLLLVILAILLPWLAVGIYTGWDVTLTLIAVVLWLLGWVPGIIFAFLVIFGVI